MQDFESMTDHQLADAIHQLADEMRNRGNLADQLRADLAALRGQAPADPPRVAENIDTMDWASLRGVIADALAEARADGDTQARPQASVWEIAHANGRAIQLAGLAAGMDCIPAPSTTVCRDWDSIARIVRADTTSAVRAYDEAETEYARGQARGAIDVLMSVHQEMAETALRQARRFDDTADHFPTTEDV